MFFVFFTSFSFSADDKKIQSVNSEKSKSKADQASSAKMDVDNKKTYKKGGTLNLAMLKWPSSFNYFKANESYIAVIWELVHASLLSKDLNNYEDIPKIAKSWEISADKLTYTFHLDTSATFSTGKNVTAEDVKFTFDLIFDRSANKCLECEHMRNAVGEYKSSKVLGKHKVQITMGIVHFDNLSILGSIPILEKAVFSKGDFGKDYNKTVAGAGAYTLDYKNTKHRKKFTLKLRKDSWLSKHPHYSHMFNFDKIVYKLIGDNVVAFEAFKRKELDLFYFEYNAYKFLDQKDLKIYKDPNLKKASADILNPYVYHLLALNMRSGATKDLEFRQALQHLLNRQFFLEKIYNNHFAPATTPFSPLSDYSTNPEAIKFDPKKASKLLASIGYNQVGKDGILFRKLKDGKIQRASVKLNANKPDYDPWLTIFVEDAKKAGVEIVHRTFEFSAWAKLMDDLNFEVSAFGLSSSIVPSPEMMWLSTIASSKSTSNYSGLKDVELDKMMLEAIQIMKPAKRFKAFHAIEKKILSHSPFIFVYTPAKHQLVYWKDKIAPVDDKAFYKYSGNTLHYPFYQHFYSTQH